MRGNELISTNFEVLLVTFSQPNSELSRILRRNLASAGVTIEVENNVSVENQDNSPQLIIGNEKINTRPITINPRARAAQYEIRLSVEIELRNGERVQIEPEILFVERTYFEDIENIAGNREEVQIITAEMRQNLVTQLMRRLESSTN
jgi:outer membrane lipopolysaccharide assembly protein LptE/RlpB